MNRPAMAGRCRYRWRLWVAKRRPARRPCFVGFGWSRSIHKGIAWRAATARGEGFIVLYPSADSRRFIYGPATIAFVEDAEADVHFVVERWLDDMNAAHEQEAS